MTLRAPTAVTRLGALGITRELTGKSYGRIFVYDRQLEILNNTDGRLADDVGSEPGGNGGFVGDVGGDVEHELNRIFRV